MYAFHARIIGRSQGKSATKAAAHNTGKRNSTVKASAYLSRSELTDAKGQTWDYSQHFGGAGSVLLLPPGTAEAFKDRQYLWQSVEKVENRSDSMLARDPIITMPWDLTQKEMWAAVIKFSKQEFVSQGKPVDLGLHIYGEPWRAWADATKAKIEVWKEQRFPFHEQGSVPADNTGPHVLIVRGKRGQIKEYYLYQPHMHLMTTFRSLDANSPTGWAKHKDTVTKEHWAVADEKYLLHIKKAWAEIGADALAAKGLHLEASRFRVGYMNNKDQRREAIKRGDLDWARELNHKPEPKKGPIASKNEREDRGHQSAEIIAWQKVKAENKQVLAINDRIADLETEIVSILSARLHQMREGNRKVEIPEQQFDQRDQTEKDRLAAMEARRDSLAAFDHEYEEEQKRIARTSSSRNEEMQTRANRGDFPDASDRWAKAMHDSYNPLARPEHNLALAVGAEAERFREEQSDMRKAEVAEQDPAKRKLLEFNRQIAACDYMAIGAERCANITGFIVGKADNAISNQDREHAQEWREIGTKLREDRSELRETINRGVYENVEAFLKDTTRGWQPVPSQRAQSEETAKEQMYGVVEQQQGPWFARDNPPGAQPAWETQPKPAAKEEAPAKDQTNKVNTEKQNSEENNFDQELAARWHQAQANVGRSSGTSRGRG